MSSPTQYTMADLKRYQILWTVASDGTSLPRIEIMLAFDAASAARKAVKRVGGFTIGTRVRAVEVSRDVLDRAVEWVNLNRADIPVLEDQPLGGPAYMRAVNEAVVEILALDAAADAVEGGS